MRKTLLFLLFAILLQANNIKAQLQFDAAKLDNNLFANLNSRFTNYSVYDLPIDLINSHINHENNSLNQIKLKLGAENEFNISLLASNILADNYKTIVASENGKEEILINKCITYQGKLFTDVESKVAFTITDQFFYGVIRTLDKEYYFEPMYFYDQATNNKNAVLVYEKSDVIIDPNLKCAVTDAATASSNMHRNPTAGTNCIVADVAIASDATMLARYGSAVAVQNHNIGVLNNVKIDYLNNQFNDNVEFKIFTQYVSTIAANDPSTPAYTGTNSGTILTNFRAWGEGDGSTGGFGSVFSYDIGQLWTTRNIDNDGAGGGSGTIGLAYVGGYCGSFQYQILEDFTGANATGSGFQLRVLTSHETGHNFNMSHDAAGSAFIMAPSVQNTSTWSAASVTSLNNHLTVTGSCNNTCVVGLPITEFNFSAQTICSGTALQFTDFTYGGPTSWSWTFQDGTPATSTIRNPSVTFATTGVKAITLTATNANGSVAKTKFILVEAAPPAACAVSGTNTTDGGIRGFTLEQISNPSTLPAGQAGAVYTNYSCSRIASLQPSTSYSGSITVGTTTPANAFNHQEIYIDYNNDGDFADANELVYTSGGSANIGTVSFSFTTPAQASITVNKLLRLRVVARTFGQSATSCPAAAAMSGAEVEDYAVSFPIVLPLSDIQFNGSLNANFKADLKWNIENFNKYKTVDLEKSNDGLTFAPIYSATVNTNNFQFTDAETISAARYYRVKLTYQNGNYFYTNVVKLFSNTKNGFVQQVFPNPFDHQIVLSLKLQQKSNVSIQLINHLGQNVYTTTKSYSSGINQVVINDLKNLPKGNYMLIINDGIERFSYKLIK